MTISQQRPPHLAALMQRVGQGHHVVQPQVVWVAAGHPHRRCGAVQYGPPALFHRGGGATTTKALAQNEAATNMTQTDNGMLTFGPARSARL